VIEAIIKPFITPIQKRIIAPIMRARALPKLIVKWIKAFFKKILNAKQISKESYVLIGNYYIQKKLIVICILVILALVYFIFIKPPAFVNRWFHFTPKLVEQTSAPITYTGKAQVFTEAKVLRYEGELAEGIYQGKGKLFAENGQIERQGDFDKGQLKQGEHYSADGVLLYSGGFSEGLYSGQGTLFYPNRSIRYQGEFQAGKPTGKGKAFDEGGRLLYEGNFASGLYAGEGIEYYPGGAVKYQGQFLAGKYNGPGKLLNEAGALVYEGGFAGGQYSGEGTAFYPAGTAQYKGQFMGGAYNGAGQAFYESGKLKYEGGFAGGVYHGDGMAYSDAGLPVYKGKFINGLYEGLGEELGADGKAVYKGYFRQGQPHYGGFLGLSGAKLEELLGKPQDTAIADRADGNPELIMNYRDYGLRIVMRVSEQDPAVTYVGSVTLTKAQAFEQLQASMTALYEKLKKEDPNQVKLVRSELVVSELERTELFLYEEQFYRFTFIPRNTLQRAEIYLSE
jgi:antitoxin component YwqK of YwqJK toxin-antitoxin module/uncharacterized coiled-coil protein SlyX